jgi:endonuclease III
MPARKAMSPLQVIEGLRSTYKPFKTVLKYTTDWQLLFAVLLSAQTTDAQVNKVTEKLFVELPSVAAIANAPLAQLQTLVHGVNFSANKAKNLKAAAQLLVDNHDSVVPKTMEELILLPGVGRKTANVFLHVYHEIASGVVVDTHIFRVSNRTGASAGVTPEKVEADIIKKLDKKYWILYSDLTIQHGRAICEARKPKCDVCPLNTKCPSAFQFPHFR